MSIPAFPGAALRAERKNRVPEGLGKAAAAGLQGAGSGAATTHHTHRGAQVLCNIPQSILILSVDNLA